MLAEQLVPEYGDLENFIEQFSVFAAAPNGIAKLRKLILSLAMNGKIVPQDPNDVTAAVLVEKIRGESVRMINKNQAIKNKSVSAFIDEDRPFVLPNGWEWVQLGDLCILENGDRSKNYPNKSLLVDSGVPFVNAGHLNDSRIKLDKITYVTEERFNLLRSGKFFSGDILYCLRGTLGKVALVEGFNKGAIASSLVIVRLFPSMNRYFFLRYFESPLSSLMVRRYDNGTAQPNLSAAHLRKFLVPLPPEEEQKRIVAKVDELMALCDQLETQQQQQANTVLRANTAAIAALLNSESHSTNPLANKQNNADIAPVTAAKANKIENPTFERNWQRIAQHFNTLYGCTLPMPPGEGRQKKHLVGMENLRALRQLVTALAVIGKLTTPTNESVDTTAIKTSCSEMRESYIFERIMRKQKAVLLDGSNSSEWTYPEHWAVEIFDSVAVVIGGLTKGRNLKGKDVKLYPYLRVANVQRGYFALEVMKDILIPIEEYDKYKLNTGDLLITEGGDWDKVGRTAIWEGQIDQCLHQNHVFKARVKSDLLLNRWVEFVFNSAIGRQFFAKSSKQTTNLASINMTQLRSFPLPIPPLEEQKRIVKKVDKLMALCDQLEQRLTQSYSDAEKLMEATVQALIA